VTIWLCVSGYLNCPAGSAATGRPCAQVTISGKDFQYYKNLPSPPPLPSERNKINQSLGSSQQYRDICVEVTVLVSESAVTSTKLIQAVRFVADRTGCIDTGSPVCSRPDWLYRYRQSGVLKTGLTVSIQAVRFVADRTGCIDTGSPVCCRPDCLY